MKGVIKNRAVLVGLASTIFFGIAFVLIPGALFIQIMSGTAVAILAVLAIRWFPSAMRALRDGARFQFQQQQLGIFILFAALVVGYVFGLGAQLTGREEIWTQSPIRMFITFWVIIGSILYLYATRSESGKPLRFWLKMTAVIAVGVLIVGSIVGQVFTF